MTPTLGAALAGVLACLLLFISGYASGSEIAFFSLSPADLSELDEERHEYWLVRRDGSVIAPVPMEKGAEFAKAFGTSDEVMTKEEYRKKFGRELKW